MKKKIIGEIYSWLMIALIGIFVGFLLNRFVVKVAKIQGNSMENTLMHNELGLTSVFHAKFLKINRFDIVVIDEAEQGHWIKRVVGLPNETLEYRNGKLLINQKEIAEPFLNKPFLGNVAKITLKENEYYVLGDNRDHSTDSRVIGPIHKDAITSSGFFVIYPMNKVGFKK